ncbi:MAG: hypothetical protein AMXMBFR47_18740 [Planctomycetota bacterium]
MRPFLIPVGLLVIACSGCDALVGSLSERVESQFIKTLELQESVKTVIGGNSDRALLGDDAGFYPGIGPVGELVLLDLSSGERTYTGVDPGERISRQDVQTDGDYAAWPTPVTGPLRPTIVVFDFDTGELRDVWVESRVGDLYIDRWVLNCGRIFANARRLADPAVGIEEFQTNLVYEIAAGETRELPSAGLPNSSLIDGLRAFSVRYATHLEEIDEFSSVVVSDEAAVVETDLETGETRTLATRPTTGTFQRAFGSPTYIIWEELDSRPPVFRVSYYSRETGEIGIEERPIGLNSPILLAAGEAGFVLSTVRGVPWVSVTVEYSLIRYDGRITTLQSSAFGLSDTPLNPNAAILGDRAIWLDPNTGVLRYYVISTGQRGVYET